jgi:hypothetical protein
MREEAEEEGIVVHHRERQSYCQQVKKSVVACLDVCVCVCVRASVKDRHNNAVVGKLKNETFCFDKLCETFCFDKLCVLQ